MKASKRFQAALTLAAITMMVLAGTALATALEGRYTATITPTTACAGTPATYDLTITCTQIAQQGLGSAVVEIPPGFAISGSPTVTFPEGKPWAVAQLGTSLVLTAGKNQNRLSCGSNGESVTLRFSATATEPALYTWVTRGYQSTNAAADAQYQIAGAQPTVDVGQCGEKCYKTETAWADGSPYNEGQGGNWATYTEYDSPKAVTLFAGQTFEAGTVNFSAPSNGYVTIGIALNSGWSFANDSENVKVQDYAVAPVGNPTPGSFNHKDSATSSPFSIEVPLNAFYGVHVDLQHEVACLP